MMASLWKRLHDERVIEWAKKQFVTWYTPLVLKCDTDPAKLAKIQEQYAQVFERIGARGVWCTPIVVSVVDIDVPHLRNEIIRITVDTVTVV